jgi:hypothetical protein
MALALKASLIESKVKLSTTQRSERKREVFHYGWFSIIKTPAEQLKIS